jgi:23S rRNA pseudouridine955/2504/2580 synthase
MNEIKFLIVDKENEGRRLDNILFGLFRNIPKSKIYSSIRKAKIKVNGRKSKPEYKVNIDDKISYPIFTQQANLKDSPNLQQHQEKIRSAIIYESDKYVVINKPPNYAVHGGSGLNFGVIEIIRSLYPYSDAFNLAHRIDKLTSGCLIVAKKMSALREIHKQFRERSVKKVYECIVKGCWPQSLKKIESKLETVKVKEDRRTQTSNNGKLSVTQFTILKSSQENTHLLALPKTGRTHQIRAHCASAGYPIVGDSKYGNNSENTRLMLHAKEIHFIDDGKLIKAIAKTSYGFGENIF